MNIILSIKKQISIINFISYLKILLFLSLLFVLIMLRFVNTYAQNVAPKEANANVIVENMTSKTRDQWRLAQVKQRRNRERFQLEQNNEHISEGDVRKMLLKNNFYSSCWTYNRDFCNPEGDFENAFVDNGDGTITDKATGLMWQKSGSAKIMTWEASKEYVQGLAQQHFAGHSDWRLPTIEELASILERSWKNGELFIEPVFDKKQKACWSLNTHGADRAWKINFHLGYVADNPLKYLNSVRAVRLKMTLP